MSDRYDDIDDEVQSMSWHHHRRILSQKELTFLQEDFQAILKTSQGERVLMKIMSDLCFFRRCDTPEEVVLNNYAKKLWSYLGDWEVGSENSIVEKLLNG
ncbi:MAG: hypothetical protein PF638_11190 [Candidatus Delongbacteria bacterium]|jgi:hypothetical protein|nr:hypothetical protein [Candidatus Delongbacteria bacterium]